MDPSLPLPDGFLPGLFAWLETRGGVAGALLVATLWLWTTLRERTAFLRRIEQLSDVLCRSIESGSAERSRLSDEYRLGHDWTVRSLLDFFRDLTVKRESSARGSSPPGETSKNGEARPAMPSMSGQPLPAATWHPKPQTRAESAPLVEPPPLPQPPTPRAPQRK